MPILTLLFFLLVSVFPLPGSASLPLQKAVAKAPLQVAPQFSWPLSGTPHVTSPFGMRFHPLEHAFLDHKGVDLRAPLGSEVMAIADGQVTGTGYGPLTGFFVTVDHGKGWRSRYLHLNKIGVHKSEQLKQGTVMALSGATGRTTGPHLHLALSHNQQAIDPVSMIAIPAGRTSPPAVAEEPAGTPEMDMTPIVTLVSGEGEALQVGVRQGNKTTFYSLNEPIEQGNDVWRIVRQYGKYKLVKATPKNARR